MTSTRADWQAAKDVVDAALVAYTRKPADRDIEALTRQLLHHGGLLRSEVETLPTSTAALTDWEALTSTGPGDGPLGGWIHARALARVARRMLKLLGAETR
ncbi:DUF6415 family natural product biosynthesis protein [Streptomyces sp. NPDC001586]|uniref:DUF6415 family natural product biosynthesis protein n=1 Tax=unclassified Streptomyces TaxID=2593676 RepID=UPI0033311637